MSWRGLAGVSYSDCLLVWVLEVTGCGRRVVVGYCAVNLSSIGMRSGLTTDIDTGLLALHLQETAPDQQVRCILRDLRDCTVLTPQSNHILL